MQNSNLTEKATFLVTGGAGFIGSNLCEVLINRGHDVRCLDNLTTGFKKNIDLLINHRNFTFINGDIRDYETCLEACDGVDYVLHHAALGSVLASLEHPITCSEININGMLNVMEASRIKKVKRFIYASSSSIYGNIDTTPQFEDLPCDLLSPYALTKYANEQYAKLYYSLYGLETIGLRYFNVFGKRQNENGQYAAVIPIFINMLIEGGVPFIYGDGNQTRDFTYIENVVEANVLACTAPKEALGASYNIASGKSISIIDLFLYISKLLDIEVEPIYEPERAAEVKHSSADISNARKLLKYFPLVDVNLGLKKSIEWYKSNK